MSESKLNNLLSIPASGIAFASGSSLIGGAIAGPVGAAVFALSGAVIGAYMEVASQRRHETGTAFNSRPPASGNE